MDANLKIYPHKVLLARRKLTQNMGEFRVAHPIARRGKQERKLFDLGQCLNEFNCGCQFIRALSGVYPEWFFLASLNKQSYQLTVLFNSAYLSV